MVRGVRAVRSRTCSSGMGHDDEDRFRALFDAHAGDVLRYATRRVAQPADAADVLVEVFTWRGDAAARCRRRRRIGCGCSASLGAPIANHRRGERRRSALEDRLRASLDDWFPIDEHPSLDEPGRSVATAMAALDPGDRELLRLSAWEQLSPSGDRGRGRRAGGDRARAVAPGPGPPRRAPATRRPGRTWRTT